MLDIHDDEKGTTRLDRTKLGAVTTCRAHLVGICWGRIGGLWAAVVLLSLGLAAGARPEEARPPRTGLGVSRAALQAVLARPEFGFTFAEPQGSPGLPRVMGSVPGELAGVALVGPAEDLTEVTLMVGTPLDVPGERPEPARYLRALVRLAAPDWLDARSWLEAQLQRAGEQQAVGLRKGHREIVLLAVDHGNMRLLTIRAGPPAPQKR